MSASTYYLLMIEDNPGDVDLVGEALRESSLPVELCAVGTPEAARAFLHREEGYETAPTPDLILLDLNLSGRSGCDVLRELKADRRLRRIPVVVMTSSEADRDVHESYDAHANCYLTKPVNLESYLETVRAIQRFWFQLVRLPSRVGDV